MNKALADHVVAPNLLDAAADPEIAFTLVLANLMSSRHPWTSGTAASSGRSSASA